jgi:DNA-binding NarL/FixJ family response regulator
MPSVRLLADDPALELRLRDALAARFDLAGTEVVDVLVSVHGTVPTRPAVEALRAGVAATRLIICLPPADPRSVRRMIDGGADGVVWSARIEASLAVTIDAVLAGQLVVPRETRRQLHRPELTTREKQVLGLVVMGLGNAEIAGKLFLTESTVKSHLAAAFRKLGVRSRAEAARLIVDPNEGLGTGILGITPVGLPARAQD